MKDSEISSLSLMSHRLSKPVSTAVVHGEATEDAMPVAEAVCHVTVMLGTNPIGSLQVGFVSYMHHNCDYGSAP
jgi:hypothetical protein